jgi:O-antigen/teichoic acid export membrane protein
MRVRMKIFNRVTGESRRRKFRNLLVCLFLLSIILTVSLWIVIEIMDRDGILVGPPWGSIGGGELLHLVVLFVLSFSCSTLYIAYYKGITETSKTAYLYLLAILAVVILARLLFRF